jgi:CRISPR-associated protein Cas2
MYIVVTYDVTDSPRRTRLAKRLKDYLDRVQKSVFEGELDEGKLRAVEAHVDKLLDEGEDSLRVYVLCAACKRRIRVYGQGEVLEDPDMYIV